MPCPHNEITIVQRSQRQSAVAAPAGELTLPASTCTFIVLCTVNKTATSRLPQVYLCKQVRLTCRRDVFIFLCFYTLPFLSSVCSRFSSADCLARIAFTLSYRSSIIISVFKLTL